jgi:hypothetical protein
VKPQPVTMYNHNGPVLVDAHNVLARMATGWTMEPQGPKPETVAAPLVTPIEPTPEPSRARRRKGA